MANGWRAPLPPEIQGALDDPYDVAPLPPDTGELPFFEDGALPPPPAVADEDIEIESAPAPAPEEIVFETDEVPPVPAVAPIDGQAAPAPQEPAAPVVSPVAAAGQAIEETQRQLATLDTRKAELLAQYGAETDPAARAELAKRVAAIEVSAGERRAQLQQQRAAYDEEAAVGDAQLQQKAREAQLASKERLSAELDAVARREKAFAGQFEVARREAANDVATAKEAVQARLKAGPAKGASWGVMLADVLTEGINASMQRRPVNLERIFDRYAQQNSETFARELQADEMGVELAGDRVSELARQAEQSRIDAAVARAAIAEEVERSLDLQISRATTEAQAAQLTGVRDLARRTREQALLAAQAAGEEAHLKRELQEAQLAKTRAEATKAMREAQPQPGGVSAAGVREATGVYLPGTETKIASFAKGEEKRSLDANKVVTASMDFLQTINRYQALIEDYGSRGLLESADFAKTDEFRQLESFSELAAQKLARILAGPGFAVTDSDVKNAKKLIQLPSGWWKRSDAAQVATETLRESTEDTLRNQLNPYLATDAQERLIKHARARGMSKKDALRELEGRATEVAKDPKADPADRVARLDVIEDRAKKRADEQGREGQWRVDASRELVDVYRAALAEPENNARNRVLRSNARKLADIRAGLEKELAEAERTAREAGINQRTGVRTVSAEEERDAVERATRPYKVAIDGIDAAFVEGIGSDLRKFSPKEAVKKIREAHRNPAGNDADD